MVRQDFVSELGSVSLSVRTSVRLSGTFLRIGSRGRESGYRRYRRYLAGVRSSWQKAIPRQFFFDMYEVYESVSLII